MANKKSGWGRWIGTLIVLGGLIAAGVWYFKRGKEAPQYQTAAVMRGDLLQVVTATGNLNPVVNVQVGSQISGRIKQIYVDFNSNVTSNQLIAQIDPSTYQVAVLRAEAQLSNSIANLTLTKVQAERADSLFANNLIPAADHDTAMAQLQQAEAEVRSSQANLASANVDLSRCSIVAPVDGVVISRNVDVGQTVAASFNTPTLFIIANDLSKMQIGALVSEADIGGVQTNQNVNFTVDAYPDRTFRGKVSQIRYGAVTNQNVVNYSAIIEVNNEDLKLLPGMTANVSIIIQQRDGVVKVPNAALRFRPPEGAIPETKAGAPGGPGGNRGPRMGGRPGGNRPSNSAAGHTGKRTVYILENKDSDAPKLKPVQITTGITDGIATEVIDGLKEGDEVVTAVIASDDSDSGPANPFGGGGRRGRRL